MSILTPFFNLIKPAKTDSAAIAKINSNMDIIDTEMHRPPLTVNGNTPDSTTRNLYLKEVPLATNLSSDIAQLVTGEFIQRASGGGAPISDGSSSILSIQGNAVHTGIVEEVLNMTVTPVERVDPITATIDRATFVAYVTVSTTITLTYTTAWSANPATYGITVTGTPVNGDVITVEYVKANRGTITIATPTSFNSTGWNLYDSTSGYAKVVKYSEEYGFLVGGNYTTLQFATTITGTKTTLSVINGYFSIPSDGYVFVTGSDATTYILATWSDWTSGYSGNFQSYTCDTIDLTTVMANFPYGLMAVGGTRDEININSQTLIHRVERLAYTSENLATVVASGVPYDADENYIYAALETPTTASITLDGDYTVSDHGIEFFAGTAVPLVTEILYGENLKDKLRMDVLTISAQALTASQKNQVLTNIGAVANDIVKTQRDIQKTVSSGYCTVSYPTGTAYDTHEFIVIPKYGGSSFITAWSPTLAYGATNITMYVRVGGSLPADNSKIQFDLVCIKRNS